MPEVAVDVERLTARAAVHAAVTSLATSFQRCGTSRKASALQCAAGLQGA
jgi:hypothetical protein